VRTVLVSGASVAGPALAHWLVRRGLRPTVVERAPAPRPGGQAIDVRGAALDVVERMGILPRIRRARTRMRGMSIRDREGKELAYTTEMAFTSGQLDGEDVELLREDLTGLLHEVTRGEVEYVFGDSVTALDEDEHGVRVAFERGRPRTFDLVVGADGLHSNVRRLAFGPEERFLRHLGTYVAIFSAENFLDLDDWQVWVRDGDPGYGVYPVRGNSEVRVTFGFASEPLGYDHHDVEEQRTLVADRLRHVGWEASRWLEAMWEAPDFYLDAVAQTRMDRWTRGRVALVGDAGYCPTVLSGQGSSLALVGAYVLADELGRGGDHTAAFARYEERMRPFVELNQRIAVENQDGPVAGDAIERAKNAISLDG
jgi:2-polyprenyl-6-methoxyphenol hydroxylase-like FAD-dependent oxidoreductase